MQAHYRLMYRAHSRSAIFRKRVEEAKRLLERFLSQCWSPYASFSGGKDSTAVLILLAQMGRTDLPICTQGDDLDYPDKRASCERAIAHLGFTDYTYDYSDISALAQLHTRNDEQVSGTFTHVMNRYRRARGHTGVIMGLRAEESWARRRLIKKFGPIYERAAKDGDGTELCCLPLHNWRGEDVFALILSTGTPYMHVYDHDEERMPHEIRFSWMASPEFFNRGDVALLRRHYPDLYNRLASYYPQIARYT